MQGFRSYSSFRKQRQKKTPAFNLIKYLIAVILILLLVQVLGVQMYAVGSKDMEPNFPKGARYISFSYGIKNPFTHTFIWNFHVPQRGEAAVVSPAYLKTRSIFFYNADFLVRMLSFQKLTLYYRYPHENPRILLRVIGLPGDELYMKGGTVYIRENGDREYKSEFDISERAYATAPVHLPESWPIDGPFGSDFQKIKLKQNEYFLLADDRNSIDDSRFWGPVPLESFRARFGVKYWPLK